MEELIKELEAVKTYGDYRKVEDKCKKFGSTINTFSADEMKNIEKLLVAVVRTGNSNIMEYIADVILERRKAIDWKNRPDLVSQIVDVVKQSAIEPKKNSDEVNKHYVRFMEKFIKMLQTNHLLDTQFDKVFEIVELAMVTNIADSPIHTAALACVTQLPWNDHLQCIGKGTKLVVPLVKQNPTVRDGQWLCLTADRFLLCAYRGVSRNVAITKEIGSVKTPAEVSNVSDLYSFASPFITELVKFCAAQEWTTDEPGRKNMCHGVLKSIMEDVLANGNVDPLVLKPIMSDIKELWTSGDEIMERDAGYIIQAVAAKDPSLVDDLIDTLLDMFLKGKLVSLFGALTKMYEHAPTKFESRLDGFVAMMQVNETNKHFILPLLISMAKQSPTAFKPNHIEGVLTFYSDPNFVYKACPR